MSIIKNMIITQAGIAEVINAEQSGTDPVVLTHIAFGSGQYTPTTDRTALAEEFKRFNAITGGFVGDNTIHLTLHDSSQDEYTVFECGVFTSTGTLFAVISQTSPLIQKATASEILLAVDVLLSNGINPESITIGDTNFVLNPATTERAGIAELATEAETVAGADDQRTVTPKGLKAKLDSVDGNYVHKAGAETISGQKTFTASPKVPTAADGTNDTTAASTAFVKKAVDNATTGDKAVVHIAGAETITGAKTFANDININGKTVIEHDVGNGVLKFRSVGSSDQTVIKRDGANVVLQTQNEGNPQTTWTLPGGKTGTVAMDADVVHLSGDETITGAKKFSLIRLPRGGMISLSDANVDVVGVDENLNVTVRAIDAIFGGVAGTGSLSVLPLGTKTAMGADAYGLSVSATGGLQLFGTHFLRGDIWTDASLKVITNNVSLYSTDEAAIGFDYANKVIFRTMPNDGTEAMFELQAWQWDNDSHSSKSPSAGVTLLKPSQVSSLVPNSVLNMQEGDARWLRLTGGTLTGNLILSKGLIAKSNVVGELTISGGTDWNDSASITLYGKDSSVLPGGFRIRAGENAYTLQGTSDGILKWDGKDIITSGDGTISGRKTFTTIAKFTSGISVSSITSISGTQIYDTTDSKGFNFKGIYTLGGYVSGGATATSVTFFKQEDATTNWIDVTTLKEGGVAIADKYFPLTGGALTTEEGISRNNDTSFLGLYGGSTSTGGAKLELCGKGNGQYKGQFRLYATDDTNNIVLRGMPDGTLTWNNKDVLTTDGGKMTQGNVMFRDVDTSFLSIFGGKTSTSGASLALYGSEHASSPGEFNLYARSSSGVVKTLHGKPDGTLKWDAKTVVTSPTEGLTIRTMTQAEYDSLTTKNASTLYIITEE